MRNLQVTAIAIVISLVIAGTAYARCGKQRWPVKTGTDADASLVNLDLGAATPSSIARLIALADPSSRPQDRRVRPTEASVFTFTATLTAFKWENSSRSGDNDYHLDRKSTRLNSSHRT